VIFTTSRFFFALLFGAIAYITVIRYRREKERGREHKGGIGREGRESELYRWDSNFIDRIANLFL